MRYVDKYSWTVTKNIIAGTLFALLMTACFRYEDTPEAEEPADPAPKTDLDASGDNQGIPLPNVTPVVPDKPITPAEAVSAMGIGINLGNTLDAPNFEGEWAKAADQRYIQSFKEAGFNHVRIPITWNRRIESWAPYTIEVDFLNRVEEIVNWALAEDLYVIINVHHDSWIKEGYQNQNTRNRFDSLWIQIAERFKNISPKVLFEILNEPVGMSISQVNSLNKRVLSIIRNVNPKRLVVYSGNSWTALDDFLAADIPDVNDKFLIGNFHNYDPWAFAGACTTGWGSNADRVKLQEIFDRAKNWSQTTGIPMTINEFGSALYDFQNPNNICELSNRLEYIKAQVEFGSERGISMSFWDDGGSFATYDRDTDSWGPEKDILVSPNLAKR